MRYSLSILPALAASAFAHGSANAHAHEERQQVDTASIFVTGATGLGDGQVHARLEINDFATRTDQFSLYMQALAAWQNVSTSVGTSYYQVAGIHGVPRVDFDNVAQCSECSSAWGYCRHNSVLFPAWHRAYVALWEQQLIGMAQEIASQYTGSKRDDMMAAAATLRQPYWDWAAKPASGNVFPSLFTDTTVTIEGPNGQITLTNPFYQYEIPQDDISAMYFTPYINWAETLRYPNSNDQSAVSNEPSVIAAFNNVQGGLQQQVYGMLTNCPDYLYMSNSASGAAQGSTCANDIEGIHNTVHTTTGGPGSANAGPGHMSSLPVAAFDAVFFVHHANVDRLFALWQSANPNSYGGSQVAVETTWTVPTGTNQDSDSDLTPFRKDANSFWTTNEVRDYQSTYSYTYPEIVLSGGNQASISQFVNMLYGSSPSLSASSLSSQVELNKQSSAKSNTANNSTSSAVASSVSSASSSGASVPAISSAVSVSASSAAASSTLAALTGSPKLNNAPATTSPASSSSGGFLGGIGGLLGGLTNNAGNDVNSLVGGVASGVGNVASQVMSDVGSVTSDVPNMIGGALGNLGDLTGDLSSVLLNVTEELLPSFFAPNGSQYQYNCHIANDLTNINGSYFVYLFDGQPNTNSSDLYLFASNLIGIMASPFTGMSMNGHVQTGAIPLTAYLQSQVRLNLLASMGEDHVVDYLTANLVWKLVVSGVEVDLDVHVGFQAAVYSSTTTGGTGSANGTVAPSWSEPIPQVQVTKGKAGGADTAPQGALVLPLPQSDDCTESATSTAPTYTSPVSPASATSTECTETTAPAYTSPVSPVSAASTECTESASTSAWAYTSPVAPVATTTNVVGAATNSAPAYTNPVAPVYTSFAPAWNGTKTTGWAPAGTATGTAWLAPTGTWSPYQGAADKVTFSMAGVFAVLAVAAAL